MNTRAMMLNIVFATFIAGCGKGGFPVTHAGGRVVCEGKPLASVCVFFEPLKTGDSAIVGKQGFAITDADGRFVVSTYGTNDGAVIGKHRVRVGPPRDAEPGYSCPCVLDSELDVMQLEVQRDGKNEFELVLKKKTGREKPTLDQKQNT